MGTSVDNPVAPPALRALMAKVADLEESLKTCREWRMEVTKNIRRIPGPKIEPGEKRWGPYCANIHQFIDTHRSMQVRLSRVEMILDWTGRLLSSEQTTDQEWADLYDTLKKYKDDPYVTVNGV